MTNSIEAVKELREAVYVAKSYVGDAQVFLDDVLNAWDNVTNLAANTDLSQVLKDLERLEKLEEFRASVIEHYPNQDLDHLDFRLNAYRHALALEEEHSHE